MAGNRIKGITIEIDGNTTKLSKSLEGVNKSLRNTQADLKDVNKLLKLDPKNTELLKQKSELLNKAIEDTNKKLDEEKKAFEALKNAPQTEETKRQQELLTREIVETEDALKKLKDEAKDFGSVFSQQMQQVGQQVSETGEKISNVGEGLTKGVTAPIVALGGASLVAFNEVDSGLDIIVAKTGATGEALEGLNDVAKSIATSVPTSFETVGTAVGEVNTRFGLTGDELEDLSTKFIKFAEINGTDVNGTIDTTQKLMTAYGRDISETGAMLDVFNVVGQQTGVGMDTLESALLNNATAIQELGLSMEEGAVLIGQLEVSGADANAVMGGLSKALKTATADGKPLSQALQEMQDSMANAEDETEALQIAYDLFGKSGATVFQAVKSGALDFTNLGASISESGGSVEATFEGMYDATDGLTMVMNQLKILGAEIGEAIMPTIQRVVESLMPVIQGLTDKWNSLSPQMQDTIVKVALIVASIGPLLVVIGKVTSGVGSVIGIVSKLIPAILGLNPIILVVVGVVGALIAIGVALYKNWDTIKAKATEFGNKIKETFDTIKTNVSTIFDAIKTTISTVWTNITTTISTAVDTVKTAVSTAFDTVKTTITTVVDTVKTAVSTAFNTVSTTVSTIVNGIKTTIDSVFGGIKTTVTTVVDAIKGAFNFQWSLPSIKLPHFSVSGSLNPIDWLKNGVPSFSVAWYRKAYDTPILFNTPTVIPTMNGFKGFGDGNGAEVVMSLNRLQQMVGANAQPTINVTVNGVQGQNVNELANIVIRKITNQIERNNGRW